MAAVGIVALAIFALTAQTPKPKGTAGRSGGDAAALVDIENAWADAVIKKDIPTLERYYADDVTDVGPDGTMTTKEQDISDIKNGVFVVESATATDLKPRIYGNAAVVTGTGDLKGTYKDQDISGRYRFTDTFVKQNGQWKCVATQVTRVMEQQ
jgi:ketosteroid isomerase-like protein